MLILKLCPPTAQVLASQGHPLPCPNEVQLAHHAFPQVLVLPSLHDQDVGKAPLVLEELRSGAQCDLPAFEYILSILFAPARISSEFWTSRTSSASFTASLAGHTASKSSRK